MFDQQSNTPDQPGDWRDDVRNFGEEMKKEGSIKADIHFSHKSSQAGWLWGVMFMLIGGLLLMHNFGYFRLHNWWALFLLIPAFGCFTDVWSKYRFHGRLTSGARSALITGVIFAGAAAFLLFGLYLGIYWPLLIVAGGVIILINGLIRD